MNMNYIQRCKYCVGTGKNAKVIPAFMKYENEYYKIAYSQKYVERA